MIVLAVDTATPVYTTAVLDSDTFRAELFFNTSKKHSQRLMPMIDTMLKELDLEIRDIDLFAAASGPGSFTGIRIGLAAFKTFSQVLNKPVVGIPSLDGLSRNIKNFTGLICPVLNARKNELYNAVYKGTDYERLTDYRAISPVKLADNLLSYEQEIIMLGDAVSEYKDFFREKLDRKIHFASLDNNFPRAVHIAHLGIEKYRKNTAGFDYKSLQPLYIRKSEAERRLASKNMEV